MPAPTIPTVDLSPYFAGEKDPGGKEKVKAIITQACSEYGFFQIVNHGVPVDLLNRALELSNTFFDYSEENKVKCSSVPGAPLPTGYARFPDCLKEKKEFFLMFAPGSDFNVFPDDLPEFREVLEEMFKYFTKTAELLESILNECLGLPPNFLKEYNNDRSWDFMSTLRYFPATGAENIGISEHEDSNCITFVFQDDVGGLEVRKNEEWIPIIPSEGTIVVNLSDVIQVLSNKRFKSATHRVLRQEGRKRHSCTFFYNLQGDKWVEPLPQLTEQIGERPKYKGFYYKDYQALRLKNKTHPPSRPEDVIHITHYEISS